MLKFKVLNVLTVGLITLSMLAPAMIVAGYIWHRHLQLLETKQALVYGAIRSAHNGMMLFEKPGVAMGYQELLQIQAMGSGLMNRAVIAVHHYELEDGILGFIIFMPLGIGLGILGHNRYLAYRSAALSRQMAALERLWHQSYRH